MGHTLTESYFYEFICKLKSVLELRKLNMKYWDFVVYQKSSHSNKYLKKSLQRSNFAPFRTLSTLGTCPQYIRNPRLWEQTAVFMFSFIHHTRSTTTTYSRYWCHAHAACFTRTNSNVAPNNLHEGRQGATFVFVTCLLVLGPYINTTMLQTKNVAKEATVGWKKSEGSMKWMSSLRSFSSIFYSKWWWWFSCETRKALRRRHLLKVATFFRSPIDPVLACFGFVCSRLDPGRTRSLNDPEISSFSLLISLSTEPFCYHIRRLSFLLWPIVECLSLHCSQSVLRMHCFVVFLPSGSTLWTSRPNADPTGVAFVSTPALICCSFPLAAIKEPCQCSFLVSLRFLLIWNNLPVDESPSSSRGVNCLVMQ